VIEHTRKKSFLPETAVIQTAGITSDISNYFLAWAVSRRVFEFCCTLTAPAADSSQVSYFTAVWE
jgi:hypothetical protein